MNSEKTLFGGETLFGASKNDVARGFTDANTEKAETPFDFFNVSPPTAGGFLPRPDGWDR